MNQTFSLDKMQPLDHPAIGIDDVKTFGCRISKGGDNSVCLGNRRLVRPEMVVGGLDLRGMDQHLAVEAHGAGLGAFGVEGIRIPEIVEDAVDRVETVSAYGNDDLH